MITVNAPDRQRLIVERLALRDRLSVAELAELTGCSEMTIRRDLELLEGRGALRRVHGGAVRIALSAADLPYGMRELTRFDAKERIAKAAADSLLAGESVILDTGSTIAAVARAIAGLTLTVTPLSLHSLFPLVLGEGITVMLPGGRVRPGELSIVGDLTEAAFAGFWYDTFIVGCCGITAEHGVTAVDLDDVRVKQAALRAARRTIVVATAEKLGRVTLARLCPVSEVDLLITDAAETAETVTTLREAGISVLCV